MIQEDTTTQQETQVPETRKQMIKNMFNSIAPTYTRINSILSLGIDRLWRKALLAMLEKELAGRKVLDLCAGTGDISKALLRRKAEVASVDISIHMLEAAPETLPARVNADALHLPFKDSSFDHATIAFGIRNMPELTKVGRELFRVLKPGGELHILELTRPQNTFIKTLYYFYLKKILPVIGGILSRNKEAYTYLAKSITLFLEPYEIVQIFKKAGFAQKKITAKQSGIATIFSFELTTKYDNNYT